LECEEKIFQSRGTLLRRAVSSLLKYRGEFYLATDIIAQIDCYISFSTFHKLFPNLSFPIFGDALEVEGLRSPVFCNFVENSLIFEDKKSFGFNWTKYGGKIYPFEECMFKYHIKSGRHEGILHKNGHKII
jgi:hypothetical protein